MYQEYFRFGGLPFPSAPDAKVYYINPVYQTALETLRHGVATRKGLMVLSGAAGIGKTTLLKKLFDDLGPTVKPIWFASGSITLAGVVRTVLKELGGARSVREPSSLIDALRAALLRPTKAGMTCCLIFEDAQDLDAQRFDELKQLDNLTADGRNLLPMILVGQPALIKKLSEPENYSFKQRVALSSQLFILARSEVDRYVKFQLHAVGHRGEELFDPGAMERLAYYSGGVPRLVNHLCDNALLAAYRSSLTRISGALIDAVAAQMGLLSSRAASFPEWRRMGLLPRVSFPREVPAPDVGAERVAPQGILPANPKQRMVKTVTVACLSLLAVGSASWALYSGAATSGVNRGVVDAAVLDSSNRQASPRIQDNAQQGSVGEVSLSSVGSSAPRISDDPIAPKRSTDELYAPLRAAGDSVNAQTAKAAARHKPTLEQQVKKAIAARAIKGVSVRVVGGSVDLGGVVASEGQKAMAEKAALAVQQIVSLTNQIKVRPVY